MPSKAALIAEAMARNNGLFKQASELVRRDLVKRGILKTAADDEPYVPEPGPEWKAVQERRAKLEAPAPTPAAPAAAPAAPRTRDLYGGEIKPEAPAAPAKEEAYQPAAAPKAREGGSPIDPNKFKATGWDVGLSNAADVARHPVDSFNEATSSGVPAVARAAATWAGAPAVGAYAAHEIGNTVTNAATRGAPKMPGAIGALGRFAGNVTGVRPVGAVLSHPINTARSVGDAGSAVKRMMTPGGGAPPPLSPGVAAPVAQRAAPVATSAAEDAAAAQATHMTEQAAARLPQRAGAFGAQALQRVSPTTPQQILAAGKTPVMSLEQLGGKELPAAARAAEGGMARRMYGSTLRAGAGAAENGTFANSFPANLPQTTRALTGEGSLARGAAPAMCTALNTAGAADIGHRIGTATLAPGTTAGDYWAGTSVGRAAARSTTNSLSENPNLANYAQSKANLAEKGFGALRAGFDMAGPASSFGLKYNPVTGPITAAMHPKQTWEEAKALPGQTMGAVKRFGGSLAGLARAGAEDAGSESRLLTDHLQGLKK